MTRMLPQRLSNYAALLLCALIVGCANLNASIKTGYDTADVYVQQTTQLLQAGAITSTEAQSRLDIIKQAKVGLDAAKTASASCTSTVLTPTACNNAQVAYDAANALLSSTLSWLIAHGKTGK